MCIHINGGVKGDGRCTLPSIPHPFPCSSNQPPRAPGWLTSQKFILIIGSTYCQIQLFLDPWLIF